MARGSSGNAPGGNPALATDFIAKGSSDARVVAGEILSAALNKDPFDQFTGFSKDNAVYAVEETRKGATSCTIWIDAGLSGDGVRGNQNLDENIDRRNKLPFYFHGNVIANSVESEVDLLENRMLIPKERRVAKRDLTDWWIKKTVREKFYTLSADLTNVVYVKSDGTVKEAAADLAAGDTFNTHYLDEMMKRAKDGWTDSNGVEHPPLIPVVVEKKDEQGNITQTKEIYPVFVGPESYRSLTNDPRWIEYQKALAQDGSSSWIKGYSGRWHNLVIIEVGRDRSTGGIDRVGIIRSDSPDFTGVSGTYTGFDAYKAGDGTVTEINFIMGAGALGIGFDTKPRYMEDSNWDSSRKTLFWLDGFFGAKKIKAIGETTEQQASIYHNKDFGVIGAVATIK